jgi:RNA polymerase sigma-70 factor (ECF subfamily)
MHAASEQFDQLYRNFHEPVRRYLARMVRPEEADDLAQEVFARVAKGLPGFEGRAKPATWIYRIATNTALDRLRNPRNRRIEIPLMEEAVDDVATDPAGSDASTPRSERGPLTRMIASEMNACIRQQVDKLPLKYRTVMVLSSLEELKNREIAEILEISLEAVKMRLHRGRAMLKEILEKECRFYHQPDSGVLACDRKLPPNNS